MSTARDAPSLSRSNAMWLSAHAADLADCIPRPGATWRWGDVDTPHRQLCQLAERNLIEKAERTEDHRWRWRTPPSTIVALAQYADAAASDIGVDVTEESVNDNADTESTEQAPFAEL